MDISLSSFPGLSDDRLEVGSIFFMHVNDTRPPKKKYFVIIGFTDDKLALGNVYINSEINLNKFRKPELIALHIPILQSRYAFLSHDSFIDCSEIYEKEAAAIEALLRSQSNSPYVGTLSSLDLGTVIQTLKTAPTISTIKKEKFRLHLK